MVRKIYQFLLLICLFWISINLAYSLKCYRCNYWTDQRTSFPDDNCTEEYGEGSLNNKKEKCPETVGGEGNPKCGIVIISDLKDQVKEVNRGCMKNHPNGCHPIEKKKQRKGEKIILCYCSKDLCNMNSSVISKEHGFHTAEGIALCAQLTNIFYLIAFLFYFNYLF